jgi:hypothetical protein
MDSPSPLIASEPIAAPCQRRLAPRVLVLLALAAYGLLLAQNMGAYAGGSDSSGYMNHARLLGAGHVHAAPRSIPELAPADAPDWLYSALGFKPAPDGHGVVPTYPTGLPLFVLTAAQVVGWTNAGNVVLWLHGMAGVALVYAACRVFGLRKRTSLIGAVIVAASPVYLFMAVQAMSDVPALVWVTAAVLAAWCSRRRAAWALAAGGAYAIAVLIRPTDALALVPIAVALGLAWRRWGAFVVGGIPGAVFFLLHCHAAYGKYLTTGYGDAAGLEWKWVGITVKEYAHWLPIEFSPAIIALLALPFLFRRLPREVLLLASWFLVFAGFYAMYSCTHESWWYMRFLLPAAPAMVVGALLVIESAIVPRVNRPGATFVACGALIVVVAWGTFWTKKFGALNAGRGEYTYELVAEWLHQHVPENAVIAAMQNSGALYYYTDFVFVRWDSLKPDSFDRLTKALGTAHRPLYAALFPFELAEQNAFTQHMPSGRWTQIGRVNDVTIWQWSPAATIGGSP